MSKYLAMLLLLLGLASQAAADSEGVVRFATLPSGPGHPEGIAADPAGRIFVASFSFTEENEIYIFGRNGQLQTTISLPGAVPLGMEFDSRGNLYVANFGGGTVMRFEAPFSSGSLPARTYPVCGGAGAGCGLNAITFDAAGILYVSDSFGGNVFRLDPASGAVASFVTHELLKPAPQPHAFPPFGANGLAFDPSGASLFVANTADDRVLRVDVATRSVSVFAESINGADGLAFDRRGRLWVAANQGDELVALNGKGRVVERRGAFEGIGKDGAAKGLLFPASIVISRGSIYVTNAALALSGPVGDEPEENVTTFTVSRVPLNDD
jgi:sugar lactone lactonase YvrE